uniref:Uncharacterized protein n=1 Tax=Ciona savignyi TaxID=51511 RepID=H2YJV0_CIOSA
MFLFAPTRMLKHQLTTIDAIQGLRRASSAGDATRSAKMTKSKKVEFAENDITMQRKLSASVPNIKSLMTSQRETPKLPRSKTTMTEKDLKSDKTDTTLSPLIELPSVELNISTPRLKRRNSNRHLKLDASLINSTNKGKSSSFLSPFGSDDRRVSNVSSVSNIDVIKGVCYGQLLVRARRRNGPSKLNSKFPRS